MCMLKVLIVDDEPIIRIGLKSMVDWGKHGFEIIGDTSNGKLAIELIDSLNPDIVFTDIKMPVMDGINLIKSLSLKQSPPLTVVLSCYSEVYLVKEALKCGAFDYFIKNEMNPSNILDILDNLKRELEKRTARSMDGKEIHDELQNNLSVIKKDYLLKILLGGPISNNDMDKKFKSLNIKINTGFYLLVYGLIDDFDKIKTKYCEKNIESFMLPIKNLLNELLPDDSEVIVDKANDFIIVYSPRQHLSLQQAIDEIGEFTSNLAASLKKYLNVSTTLGVSSLSSNIENIGNVFNEAMYAALQRFKLGGGRVISFDSCKSENSEQDDSYKDFLTYSKNMIKKADQQIHFEQIDPLTVIKGWRSFNEEILRKIYFNIIVALNEKFDIALGAYAYEDIMKKETVFELSSYLKEYISKLNTGSRAVNNEYDLAGRAIKFINEHYADNISLKTVASNICINSSYLSRIFKEKKGENLVDFINSVKIEKSKDIIRNNDIKVSDVSEMVGFHNYTYFSKVFKNITGESPRDYKRKFR